MGIDHSQHPNVAQKLGITLYCRKQTSAILHNVCAISPSERTRYNEAMAFLTGTVSSAASQAATAPFERVKLLLQNQDELIKIGRLSEPYKGIRDCFCKIIRAEGFVSLWRGYSANIINCFSNQALCLVINDEFKRGINIQEKDHWFLLARNLVTGGASGALALLVTYPVDYLRTRLANDVKVQKVGYLERDFRGLLDVYKKTRASDGLVGLYRGYKVSCLAIVINRGLSLGLYDTLKHVYLTGKMQDSDSASFALGWVILFATGTVCYPLDTVSKRMMMTSGESRRYDGFHDAIRQIIKLEGCRSFYKGAGTNVLRAVAGAGVLSGYDKLHKTMIDRK